MNLKCTIIFFIFTHLVLGQKNKNQHFLCNQTKSSSRAFDKISSLTDDQSKIDITYYQIDFEIDFNNEQIFGSVLANGFVGMDQPDFLEFDFFWSFLYFKE